MRFLLSPLSDQFDSGFGIVGHSFKSTAEELESQNGPTADFHRHLPICYLYRHSIELFLKSAIIIFHRKFQLAYGTSSSESKPQVVIQGQWKTMYSVHSVSDLYAYLDTLFRQHQPYLADETQTDWTMPAAVPRWIALIEGYDRQSTFFRYPVTSDPRKDTAKSGMAEMSATEFASQVASGAISSGVSLLLHDEDGNPTRAFHPDEPLPELLSALREAASFFSSMHVGLRMELCKGS